MTSLSKLVPSLAPDQDLSLALDHLERAHRITTGKFLVCDPPTLTRH